MQKPIVRAAIHPGIGIARVGNSEAKNNEDFFVGPQVPWRVNGESPEYRDSKGALKRQAAEFRIYGYDEDGRVVAELTSANATITWFAKVANKKASWFQADIPMDLDSAVTVRLRNPQYKDGDRDQLNIRPVQREISGRSSSDLPIYRFDTGTCVDQPVDLGELRTDGKGRLLFLGGKGVSGTFHGTQTAVDVVNNDGWYDDTSDGPIWAEVAVDNEEIPVDPAWVVVAPPNYAPEIVPIVSMYDQLMQGTAYAMNSNPGYDQAENYHQIHDKIPSFVADILPIFLRFSNMQWVNSGFASMFGLSAPFDFTNVDLLEKLSDPTSLQAPLRLQIFNQFRNPAGKDINQTAWPPVYGDVDPKEKTTPQNYLSVTMDRYSDLKKWALGCFTNDWTRASLTPGSNIDSQPLADRPGLLDKAALTYCIGGPFGPGTELPWIMRNASIYRAFGRIRRKSDSSPELDYGDELTKDMAMAANGPLGEQAPGDITRWMSVPWQSDTANCDAGYVSDSNPSPHQPYDPYLPTYWPARVPNHVLTRADYEIFIDKTKPRRKRLEAFARREPWMRDLAQGWIYRMTQMVNRFHTLPIVVRKPGVKGMFNGSDVFVEDR